MESIEEFGGSDSSETADSNATSVMEEPAANPEYFEVPKAKKGKAKKGSARALITSKQKHVAAIPKKDTDGNQDVLMVDTEEQVTSKRKRTLSKSMQVKCSFIFSFRSDFSSSVPIKKSKLPIPGLLKGFVPIATSTSRSPSVMITAENSQGNTISSDVDFKMGGLENLDEDGIEVADKKYPKYAEIGAKARGKRGLQVRVSKYACTIVDSIFYRL